MATGVSEENLMCQADVPASCEASSLRSSNERRGEAGNQRVSEITFREGSTLHSSCDCCEHAARGLEMRREAMLLASEAVSEALRQCQHTPDEWLAMSPELFAFKKKIFGILELRCLPLGSVRRRSDEEAPLGADERSQTAETEA